MYMEKFIKITLEEDEINHLKTILNAHNSFAKKKDSIDGIDEFSFFLYNKLENWG